MMNKEAKQRLKKLALDMASEHELDRAEKSTEKAVRKIHKRLDRDEAGLKAMIVTLDSELMKKSEALRQINRGVNRLHRTIDRLRAEREIEKAEHRRTMAITKKMLFEIECGKKTNIEVIHINGDKQEVR